MGIRHQRLSPSSLSSSSASSSLSSSSASSSASASPLGDEYRRFLPQNLRATSYPRTHSWLVGRCSGGLPHRNQSLSGRNADTIGTGDTLDSTCHLFLLGGGILSWTIYPDSRDGYSPTSAIGGGAAGPWRCVGIWATSRKFRRGEGCIILPSSTQSVGLAADDDEDDDDRFLPASPPSRDPSPCHYRFPR
ncbi:hypothetical protein EX30DRAFT_221573 [Ascodesmis nigricans]|uniref:Uncharacterized protein n=1 Tax=Ascodesmis nigricans TaxID=341454 RepID=A0A4S2MZT4_9PEZI|nr:hypothetical protein EX30DRAFT_221573 [Ascodesmis nigricans]